MPVACLLIALFVTACADQETIVRAAALRGAAEDPPALQTSRMRSAEPSMAGPSDATLASPDPAERERAVLEFEGDLAALAPLASDDASANVRLAAVQRLAEGETPVARAALRRALDDPDSGVVVEAILALSTIGDGAAIPSLERLRAHPDPELRALAEDALGALARD